MANITDEKQYGLASKHIIKCQFCSKENTVDTSSTHKCGKAGSAAYDINSRATLASLPAGIGETQLTSTMSIMNIPPMARASFKTRERETGKAVENVARASCDQIIANEKDKLIGTGDQLDENNLMPVSCSCDMGWQKRGKGFNSNTGHSAVMNQSSGKNFDFATKGKKCRTCEYAERSKTTPKINDCPKNHTGSLKFMEPLTSSTPHIPATRIRPQNCTLINTSPIVLKTLAISYTSNAQSPQDCTISVQKTAQLNLPNSRDLYGDALKSTLTEIFKSTQDQVLWWKREQRISGGLRSSSDKRWLRICVSHS